MVLPFQASMVGGVKAKHEQLLAQGYGTKELSQAILGLNSNKIKENAKRGVQDEAYCDGSVLEVAKIGSSNGAIRIKTIVPEELGRHVVRASQEDNQELQVPYFWGGEPWVDGEGFRFLDVELDVIKQVPQANDTEP